MLEKVNFIALEWRAAKRYGRKKNVFKKFSMINIFGIRLIRFVK